MKLLTPFLCPSLFSSLALSFSLHPRDDFDSIGLRWGPGILGSRSSIDQSKLHPKKQNKTKQNKTKNRRAISRPSFGYQASLIGRIT